MEKNRLFRALSLAIMCAVCGAAWAAQYEGYTKEGIRMLTGRYYGSRPANFEELVKAVESAQQGPGYGETVLKAFEGVNNSGSLKGLNNQIAFTFDLIFTAEGQGEWEFEFGVDAGIASGCKIDDTVLWFSNQDTWTEADYSKAFTRKIALKNGWHRMTVYGLESCCDGVWRLRFKSPYMKEFKTVSTSNLPVRCR